MPVHLQVCLALLVLVVWVHMDMYNSSNHHHMQDIIMVHPHLIPCRVCLMLLVEEVDMLLQVLLVS